MHNMYRINIYGDKDRFFTIVSNTNTYRVMIRKMNPRYTLFIGGCKKRCITITKFIDNDNAHIEGITYDTLCNISKDMKRSSGTIDMIKTALTFLIRIFPKIRTVSFVDKSEIYCKNNAHVYLASYHFLKYGKTWYEDKFDAIPEESCDRKVYNRFKKNIGKYTTSSFKEFCSLYLEKNIRNKSAIMRTIRPHYDTNDLIFLKRIQENEDCSVFYVWLYEYMQSKMKGAKLYQMFWNIKADTIISWEHNINITQNTPEEKWTHQFGGKYEFDIGTLMRNGIAVEW